MKYIITEEQLDNFIEKLMSNMGIKYNIEVARPLFMSRGKYIICYVIEVWYEGEIQYEQYHCYEIRRDGKVVYEDGNTVKSIESGILSFLGMNKEVSKYFSNKTREMASNISI